MPLPAPPPDEPMPAQEDDPPFYYEKERAYFEEPNPDPQRHGLRMIRLDPFTKLLRGKGTMRILLTILAVGIGVSFLFMLLGGLLASCTGADLVIRRF